MRPSLTLLSALLFLQFSGFAQTAPKAKLPAKSNPVPKAKAAVAAGPRPAPQVRTIQLSNLPSGFREWPVLEEIIIGGSTKIADELFNKMKFREAADAYLKISETDPAYEKASYYLALSYLLGSGDRTKSIPFLEFLSSQPEKYPHVTYYLAKAYAYALRFDDAVNLFKKIGDSPTPPVEKDWIKREIEMCENGKLLMSQKVSVVFENLGNKINTEHSEINPYISSDESFLVFSSNRGPAGASEKLHDVYMSLVDLGNWSAPQNVGEEINSPEGDERVVGVAADGQTLLYSFIKGEEQGNLFVGPYFQRQILPAFKLGSSINSSGFEHAAAISPDGKTLYFSSNRPGGQGGFDLYRSLILPNGEWSEALNLGPEINTPYDEDFPFLSMDGKELYFASKGHNSMGGYDVFRASFDEGIDRWQEVKNIGYPVNNAYDNEGICMSGTGKYAYASYPCNPSPDALKSNPSSKEMANAGYGDKDLYRIVYRSVDAELCVLRGQISSATGANKIVKTTITITRLADKQPVGTVLPNDRNNYVIILPPGEYNITVQSDGYKDFNEAIAILGKGSFVPFVEKNILLSPR
jgi:hypothetical protein